MRARVPAISNKQKKQMAAEMRQYIDKIVDEHVTAERIAITRRLFKTMIAVLHNEFGFGHDRALKAINAMTKMIEHSDEDEVFWEHIDRIVIDELGIPFDRRDYTDNGKVVEYD